jgi:hypothetical protein
LDFDGKTLNYKAVPDALVSALGDTLKALDLEAIK